MKRLLSDEMIELILDNIKGIGYTDILDMIDNEEIHIKEEKDLDIKRTMFVGSGKVQVPAYNTKYSIGVKNGEFPITTKVKTLYRAYEDNRTYLKDLIKQYNKFLRKVYIDISEVNSYLDEGYNVSYDGQDGMCFYVFNKNDKFTIEELSKVKFYVMK